MRPRQEMEHQMEVSLAGPPAATGQGIGLQYPQQHWPDRQPGWSGDAKTAAEQAGRSAWQALERQTDVVGRANPLPPTHPGRMKDDRNRQVS